MSTTPGRTSRRPPDYDPPARRPGWQIGGWALAGASSVAPLEENLAAVDLELSVDQHTRLDAAH